MYFVSDFYEQGHDLYLYDSKEEQRYRILKAFLQAGIERGRLCVYAYPMEKYRYSFSGLEGSLTEVELIRGKIKMLKSEDLREFYSELERLVEEAGERGVNLLVDYGRVREELCEELLELERRMHELLSGSEHATISSFNLNYLTQDFVNELIKMHDRVMLTTQEGKTSMVFHSRRTKPVHIPRIEVISSEIMEHSVKKALHFLILAMLRQRPMCGFDIIKSLVENFNVLLSQGTVYPILYSLEKDGYLKTVIKSDNKTKLYVPTEKAISYIDRQIKEYIQAQEKILSLISRGLESGER
ncbi:MAG: hypothetical protein GXN98_04495 [Euryarchaeota archaeon]|nr:hypothetical protein [Euryarchaeota archaeon]